MESKFISLFILCFSALLTPILTDRLKVIKVPEVVADILVGIIIGKSGLNLIETSVPIEFIALFGFSFLMFLSGMEVDISGLKSVHRNKNLKNPSNPLFICMLIFLFTILLSYLLSHIFIRPQIHIDPLLTAAIFCTTSLGIVVPILKEKKLMYIPLGQVILLISIIADLFTMFMIPFIMYRVTGNSNKSLIGFILLPILFIVALFLLKNLKRNFRRRPAYSSSQIDIRAALALMLMFITLSELINIEVVIGAFLSGILFSLLFNKSRLEMISRLDIMGYGFFIPIFFINIGVNLDLQAAYDSRLLATLTMLLIIGFTVKIIPSLLLKRYFLLKEAVASGFLLSSNLSLTVAISFVAWNSGIINESIYSSFLLYAILSSIISPIVFLRILNHI